MPQRFCSSGCRQDFYAACRDWAVSEVRAGRVLVSTVRDACQKPARSLQRDPGPDGIPNASEAGSPALGLSPVMKPKRVPHYFYRRGCAVT